MPEAETARKYNLPVIKRISLVDFDLYQNEPDATVQVNKNVFCLVGANGLGKSTFLNTLSYTVTGAVPDPDRTFLSAKDYFRNARRHERTEDYFTGRIGQLNRVTARSEVELAWRDVIVCVTRDFFSNHGAVRLVVQRNGNEKVLDSDEGITPEEIEDEYVQQIVNNTGLDDFAQFVFLVHFVMTFDEGRHLLMWDDAALTTALYLAFGADPSTARHEEVFRREMEREDSRARNVRFAARRVMDRIDQLKLIIETGDDQESPSEQELKAEYDQLVSRLKEREGRNEEKQIALRDVELRWTDASSQLTELQIEYRKAFADRLSASSVVKHHPIVRSTLSEDVCAICNTQGVATTVEKVLHDLHCPLCNSPFDGTLEESDTFERLKAIDQEIAEFRDKISLTLKERERMVAEVESSASAVEAARSQLAEFEGKNADSLSVLRNHDGFEAVSLQLGKLKEEYDQLIDKSQSHRKKRDEIRGKLRQFEKDFKKRYSVASEEFVPRFRELSEAFIGLDIDIQLNEFTGANKAGFGFNLQMSGQLRQRPEEMSESQRFFIDIALRMALVEFMANSDSTLLIDTPEGSLDIAYEARAGQMFFKFVERGNRILMTANLKSSQLILRLARLCRSERMEMVRMTDWSELTAVQLEEEGLFEKAYKNIEKELAS